MAHKIAFNTIVADNLVHKELIYSDTCLKRPPNVIRLCLLGLIYVALGHLDKLQVAEIVSKSKLVPSVVIETHYWINCR